jgi:hypothetical protein
VPGFLFWFSDKSRNFKLPTEIFDKVIQDRFFVFWGVGEVEKETMSGGRIPR